MKSTRRPYRSILDLALACAGTTLASQASAQENTCTILGDAVMSASTTLYAGATGDTAIARFTGARTALQAKRFPTGSASARAAVSTGTGSGSFRLDGFVEATEIPLIAARDVPAILGHVWIAAQRPVKFADAGPDRLKVTHTVSYPLNQTFTAWAGCDSFSLSQGTAPTWSVPGNARGYVVQIPEVELYNTWTRERTLVSTLRRADFGNGILLWSEERRSGYAHVMFHGDVIIDGWVQASKLKWLPPGETMDQIPPGPITRVGAPQLRVQGTPKVVKATREVPLRSRPNVTAPTIGAIEPGTETYVIDVVAGWASVMPKSMGVAPAGDAGFWASMAELGAS